MHTWKITHLDPSEALAEGTQPTRPDAWAAAITEALDLLAASVLNRCRIVIDGQPALLIAGRDEHGEIDLAATRGAAERMAAACCGVPL